MLKRNSIIYNKNFQIGFVGSICFLIHVFMLYWRPMESWCDDAFFADLGYQLSIGSDTSHVFPNDRAEMSLFGLMYASWYRIVGFSFFTAQLPNLVVSLLSFVILAKFVAKQASGNSVLSILTLAVLFWFAPVNYWTMCCGRAEMMSLLFGIIVIVCFVSDYEAPSVKYKILLAVSSFFLLSISFQGVLGATILLVVFCFFDLRKSAKKYKTILVNVGGYLVAFMSICVFKLFNNTLKSYIFHTLGYSTTLRPLYAFLYQLVYHEEYVGQNNLVSTTVAEKMSLWNQFVEGLLTNKDFCILAIMLLALAIIVYSRKQWKKSPVIERTMVLVSFIVPIVFTLAGRYPVYYTWIAYIPCVVSIVLLTQRLKYGRLLQCVLSIITIAWLFVSSDAKMYMRVDFKREIDTKNRQEIKECIDLTKPNIVPHSWFYYLVGEKNVYYQSGPSPANIDRIVVSPKDYVEDYTMNSFEYEFEKKVNEKTVYKVNKRKW